MITVGLTSQQVNSLDPTFKAPAHPAGEPKRRDARLQVRGLRPQICHHDCCAVAAERVLEGCCQLGLPVGFDQLVQGGCMDARWAVEEDCLSTKPLAPIFSA